MAAELNEDVATRVLAQAEFYFSDSNLVTDKYLLGQVQDSEDELISIPIICSFKRMRKLLELEDSCLDKVPQELVVAVADILCRSSFLRVSDDGSKVGRVNKIANVEEIIEQVNLRTIAAGPLPFDVKLEDVESFFKQYGKVNSVRLPHHPLAKKVFCGTALVEFSSVNGTENISTLDLEYNGVKLEIKSKKEYEAERATIEATNDGQSLYWLNFDDRDHGEAIRKDTRMEEIKYTKGLIVSFKLLKKSDGTISTKSNSSNKTSEEILQADTTLSKDKSDEKIQAHSPEKESQEKMHFDKDNEDSNITREDINATMKKFGRVMFVDFTMGKDSGFVRFQKPEESKKARMATTSEDGGLIVKNCIIKLEALDGEAEKIYWKNIHGRQSRNMNCGQGNRGRGRHSKGNWTDRRQRIELHADNQRTKRKADANNDAISCSKIAKM